MLRPKSHWNLDFPEFTVLDAEDRSKFLSDIFLFRTARLLSWFCLLRYLSIQVFMGTYLLFLHFLNIKSRGFSIVLNVSLRSFFLSATTRYQSQWPCCLRLMFKGLDCWHCDFESRWQHGYSFLAFVVRWVRDSPCYELITRSEVP